MSQSDKLSNRKYIQIVLIAILLLGSSGGLNMNTMGVFLGPLAISLNSSVSSLSFLLTLFTLGTGLASFFVPPILNRFTYRQVITISTVITVLATMAMGWTDSLLLIYVLGFIRGFASAFFGPMAAQLLINNWFFDKHGLVTSLVFAGSGLFGAIASPLVSIFIDRFGVNAAFYFLALLVLLANLLGIFSRYQFDPKDEGRYAYGLSAPSLDEIDEEDLQLPSSQLKLSGSTFLTILGIGLATPAVSSLVQHLSTLTSSFDFPVEMGGFVISAALLASINSNLLVGSLTDKKEHVLHSLFYLLL